MAATNGMDLVSQQMPEVGASSIMPNQSYSKGKSPTHCNTLQHTATHFNTLQHSATQCNKVQHRAIQRNAPNHIHIIMPNQSYSADMSPMNCNTLQPTATYRNAETTQTALC